MTDVAHPAKFSEPIIDAIAGIFAGQDLQPQLVVDPFAGVGGVHALTAGYTVGTEIEWEWARQAPGTLVADALDLPFPDDTFGCLVSSPCYANRAADHHNAQDASKRNTYRHLLGRDLHEQNAGAMQWGPTYRSFHAHAWEEAARVLAPESLVVVNVSNHIRGGEERLVAEWHLAWWLNRHAKLISTQLVPTRRLRYGANSHLRVNGEWVFAFRLTK